MSRVGGHSGDCAASREPEWSCHWCRSCLISRPFPAPHCDHHHVKTILHNETGGGEGMEMRLYRSMVLVPLHALLNITQYSTIAISRQLIDQGIRKKFSAV